MTHYAECQTFTAVVGLTIVVCLLVGTVRTRARYGRPQTAIVLPYVVRTVDRQGEEKCT